MSSKDVSLEYLSWLWAQVLFNLILTLIKQLWACSHKRATNLNYRYLIAIETLNSVKPTSTRARLGWNNKHLASVVGANGYSTSCLNLIHLRIQGIPKAYHPNETKDFVKRNKRFRKPRIGNGSSWSRNCTKISTVNNKPPKRAKWLNKTSNQTGKSC